MAKVTISLPDSMSEYISDRIRSGPYESKSEYFRDLVRRDQEHFESLRRELIKGEQSAESSLSPEDILNRARARAKFISDLT